MSKKGEKTPRTGRPKSGEPTKVVKEEPFKAIPMRLQQRYQAEVTKALKERFNYKNVMQIPRLEKVVINLGVGDAIGNPKMLDTAVKELTQIVGQKPVVTKARNSISNFKLREGQKIGTKVTLRRAKMWAFLDKLFSVVLPRIRDFRGLSPKSFDGRGNYAIGLKEQIIFPEIDYDQVDRVRGMDIAIVTTAKTDEEASEFLKLLGCPIRPSN
jgi:large subunit ribosomal protein L5